MQEPENDFGFSKLSVLQNKWLLWLSVINVLLNTLSAYVIAVISAYSGGSCAGAVHKVIFWWL